MPVTRNEVLNDLAKCTLTSASSVRIQGTTITSDVQPQSEWLKDFKPTNTQAVLTGWDPKTCMVNIIKYTTPSKDAMNHVLDFLNNGKIEDIERTMLFDPEELAKYKDVTDNKYGKAAPHDPSKPYVRDYTTWTPYVFKPSDGRSRDIYQIYVVYVTRYKGQTGVEDFLTSTAHVQSYLMDYLSEDLQKLAESML